METNETAIQKLWTGLGIPFQVGNFILNDWGWAGWSVYEVCTVLKNEVSSDPVQAYRVAVNAVHDLLQSQTGRPWWLNDA